MSSAGVTVLSPVRDEPVVFPNNLHSEFNLCSEESIMVYLDMSGSMTPFRVLESDSIDSVKLKIQTCKGFVVKNQKLVCGGRELARSDSLVRDYGVVDGNVLHLVLRLSDLQEINVRTASGKEFTFHVERGKNVGYVKHEIAKKGKEFVDLEEQEVVYNGERVEDQRLIDDLGKHNDAVIHLLVRKSAKVRARPVEKNLELSIVVPQLIDGGVCDVDRENHRSKSDVGGKNSGRGYEADGEILPKKPPDRGFLLEPVIVNHKIKLPSVVWNMVNSTYGGLESGHYPIRSMEGAGGVYFMLDTSGQKYVSVFTTLQAHLESGNFFIPFLSKKSSMKRKRGPHKPQNPSTATSPNDIVPIPTTEPGTTDPNNPSSSPTRGRGGGARPRKNPRPNIAASPERRGSRHADQNGDFTHSTTTNTAATAIAATTSEAVGVSEPVKWETVVKVVPSMDAVVKVFCVHTEPNFSLMWQRKRQYSSSSSGFIIGGRRVLTNAHSVEHHTQVKLKKRGSDTKYLATVLAIGTECDIALLTVSDDEFWEGVSPVEFGDLPALQDAVTVVGYPIGGDTISVTSGVVSRIEILSYVHGSTELLGLQIDAAINSGNSGGPAFNDKGKCVGIAFQSLKHEDVENIGYVIPTPVIEHFIKDYEKNGAYTGFPILGVEWQKMENPDLRIAMGMESDQKGVRIRRIEPTAPESQVLKPSDVILSFDGINIANDGTVPFRQGERIGFSYLVSQKYTGDCALVKVLRDSKVLEFNIKLATHKRLIPAHIRGRPPSYYIIAGFVFTSVSVPYLRSEYGKDYEFDAPVKLLDKHLHAMAESVDEQLVVISQVLVADINIGYEDIVNTQVHAFNGKPVKNLKSLASMVESCEEEYLKFELEYQQIVVLQTKTAKAATLDILATHCIPSAMSDDLKIDSRL